MQAILFDMDGVICDNLSLHHKIQLEILNECGADIGYADFNKFNGMSFADQLDLILDSSEVDIEELVNKKISAFITRGKGKIRPVKGIYQLLKRIKTKFKLAIVSGSPRKIIDFCIDELNLTGYFDIIVSCDDVTKGKPDPESFLLASKKLNISSKKCIVIEDGLSGMIAAKKANMFCIALVNDLSKNVPADKKVLSLTEISLNDF